MKQLRIVIILFIVAVISLQATSKIKPEKDDIRIAVQAWSFRQFSFEEAVKEASKIGFKYIEMYPGQKIKAGAEDNTHFTMTIENRELVKSILKENKIVLVQYGVVSCNSKEEWIKLFDFCSAMGIETINSEPEFSDFILLDSLTQAYKVNLAVHNHATGTRYWDPQIVLDQIKGKNPYIGVCADNGHWMRSGLDPVESLKKVQGHLMAMHIKDMSEFNNLEAHTVPFGTGVLDAGKLIAELKRQGFKGVLTLENEYNWEKPGDDLTISFKNLTQKLAD